MTTINTLVLTTHHADFPIGVRAMARPPSALYVRGRLPHRSGIAVVGTRCATAQALAHTRKLAAELASAGVAVWSGGADGIDTQAHRGALQANGCTVVVMGTGMAHTYPVCNRALFDTVLEQGGAWLSPFEDRQRGARWTFLLRNELLASMVDGVVVVQAPLRSGARSTAAAARRMGKPVWVVPASPWDVHGAGCCDELRLGAHPLCSTRQLLASVGRGGARDASPRPRASRIGMNSDLAQCSTTESAILRAIRSGCHTSDDICIHAQLPAGQVAAALLTLTLRHILLESSDGFFHLVKY
ncbi:MAG: DNA-protecting protein DprA [Polyangiaceae bacterium]|jgi:DNA processing protein|nr:DNA-protecting protein DprA [Polyangiaceae bacterium]